MVVLFVFKDVESASEKRFFVWEKSDFNADKRNIIYFIQVGKATKDVI